ALVVQRIAGPFHFCVLRTLSDRAAQVFRLVLDHRVSTVYERPLTPGREDEPLASRQVQMDANFVIAWVTRYELGDERCTPRIDFERQQTAGQECIGGVAYESRREIEPLAAAEQRHRRLPVANVCREVASLVDGNVRRIRHE